MAANCIRFHFEIKQVDTKYQNKMSLQIWNHVFGGIISEAI